MKSDDQLTASNQTVFSLFQNIDNLSGTYVELEANAQKSNE